MGLCGRVEACDGVDFRVLEKRVDFKAFHSALSERRGFYVNMEHGEIALWKFHVVSFVIICGLKKTEPSLNKPLL